MRNVQMVVKGVEELRRGDLVMFTRGLREVASVDMGGSKDGGADPMSKFLKMVQTALFSIGQNAVALPGSADAIAGLCKKAGIDINAVLAAAKSGDIQPLEQAAKSVAVTAAAETTASKLTKV